MAFDEDAFVNGVPDPSVESWAVRASSVFMLMSARPEDFTDEQVREAVEQLTQKMPTDLVVAGTLAVLTSAMEMDRDS